MLVELQQFGPDDEASVATYVAVENACLVDAPWWHPTTVNRQTMLMRHGWDGEVGRHFLLHADGLGGDETGELVVFDHGDW